MRRIRRAALLLAISIVVVLPGLRAEDQLPLPGRDHQQAKSPERQRVFTEAPPGMGRFRGSATDRYVLEQLDRVVSDINLDAMPYPEALRYISELTGVTIDVAKPPLKYASISEDTPVTLRVANPTTVRSVLNVVLTQMAGGETELNFEVSGGMIHVSTKEDLCRRTVVRVYDYRDLIDEARRRGPQYDKEDPLERLIQLIQETVDPESWRSAGGNVGQINTFGGLIIVDQTTTAHDQIYNLLEIIRSAYFH